jgi:hypothetical protein
LVEWNIQKNLSHQQDVKNPMTEITSNILSMIWQPINLFH